MPSTEKGTSTATRRTIPAMSPTRRPWINPRNTNTANVTAAMFRTVAYGDPAPANHTASTSGRAEVNRNPITPSTKKPTASRIHVAMPSATLAHAQPVGAVTAAVTTSTGFGTSTASIIVPPPRS